MRPIILSALLALGGCAASAPQERVFAVFFVEFSTDLDAPAQAVVARAAQVALRNPGRLVHVLGYADGSATNDAVSLSQRRAVVVSQQLQADGVPPALIDIAAGGSPADSQPGVERRRVEIDLDLP